MPPVLKDHLHQPPCSRRVALLNKDGVEVSGCLAMMGSKSMLHSVAQQSHIDDLDDLRFNSLDKQGFFSCVIDQDRDGGELREETVKRRAATRRGDSEG